MNWIPVTERLPKKDGQYFAVKALCPGEYVYLTLCFGDIGYEKNRHKGFFDFGFDYRIEEYPVAWMPIPKYTEDAQ